MAPRGKRQYFKLTPRQCHNATTGRHGDGLGLYLDVRPSGSRAWVFRVVIERRRQDRGLGNFPTVTLDEARDKMLEYRRLIRKGVNPFARSEQERVPTVRGLVPKVIAKRKRTWRGSHTEASWWRTFNRDVLPIIGDLPINRVTVKDVERVVDPLWNANSDAGELVRQRLDVLFRQAIARKYCSENPAHDLLELFPRVQREPVNRPSVPHDQVRSALELFRTSSASPVVKDVLLYIVLTAARF